jgi:hypothetical protein
LCWRDAGRLNCFLAEMKKDSKQLIMHTKITPRHQIAAVEGLGGCCLWDPANSQQHKGAALAIIAALL